MYDVKYDVPVHTFFKDEQGLLNAHFAELSSYPDKVKLKPDIEKYTQLQDLGVLKNICIYREGSMIGYSLLFIQPHIHYSDDLFAHVDVIYIDPQYRGSRAGIKLLIETEKRAKELGTTVLTYHTKPAHNVIEKILVKLGYNHIENIFGKLLED